MSKLRLASRSEAQRLVRAGAVTVNGRVVTDPLAPVVPERDAIAVAGKTQPAPAWRTIAFHKPRGTVTTRRDPQGRRTVFDVLGEALAPTHRVLAVDMPGRGASQWLAEPNDYVVPTYLTTLTALVARSGAQRVDWVGTSMGALLGMVMAAQPQSPIARLVINDAGPVIEPAALARIGEYVGLAPAFATFADADAYIRRVSAPFGALTDAQWDHLTRTSVAQRSDGQWALTYDPGIAAPFRNGAAPPYLWPLWDEENRALHDYVVNTRTVRVG